MPGMVQDTVGLPQRARLWQGLTQMYYAMQELWSSRAMRTTLPSSLTAAPAACPPQRLHWLTGVTIIMHTHLPRPKPPCGTHPQPPERSSAPHTRGPSGSRPPGSCCAA